ncbi:MAG: DUF2914 domain-containing protein [Alphaproteobacteria bacterium]|nr:DUF2914 domain-containing protein [Alphaproteobacteria bacterium]
MSSAAAPDNPVLARVRAAWGRWRHGVKPLMFLGGVLWDYLTLRIDRTLDHLLLVTYFAWLVVAFAFQMRVERERWVPEVLVKRAWVLDLAASFCLGALLSALGITVLRATHPGPTALFVGLLLGLAAANEAGVTALRGSVVRFAMVAFLAFQLVSLVTPILFHTLVGVGLGLVGATLATGFLLFAIETGPTKRKKGWVRDRAVPALSGAGGVLALLILIWLGVVPPLPLVLREAVLARDVQRVEGDYALVEPHRRAAFLQILLGPPSITWAPGQTVAVYTAVFAPPDVDLVLTAVWEHWDDVQGAWVQTDRIDQQMQGGRSQGWRSWTRKRNVQPGAWRVRIETPEGREVGRTRFEVVASEPQPASGPE